MALSENDPQAWLETNSTRRTSDLALGVIAHLVGVLFIWVIIDTGYAGEVFADFSEVSPMLFPAIVGGLLCSVGALLLLRGVFRHSPPVRAVSPLHLAVVATLFFALCFAVGSWLFVNMLIFGPREFMVLTLLQLVIAFSLAHSSRTRAAAMLLIGLLLSTAGLDTITGVLRFTMGIEEFIKGIDLLVVLFGLFWLGDALLCLVSVPLFLRTYTRLVAGLQISEISTSAAVILRISAVIVLIAAPLFAYSLHNAYVDIAWIFGFGIMGAAGKIFGWNRFLLYWGFALGPKLEDGFRQAMMGSQGDFSAFLREPVSGAMLMATFALLVVAMVFSLRRGRVR